MIQLPPPISFEDLSLGSTFNYGKYQVDTETPWDLEWEVVHQTDDYNIAMTKQIIDFLPFDAIESSNIDSTRKTKGNNDFSVSNIKQYLNSDQASWYSAQHTYDAPPTEANCYVDSSYPTAVGYDTKPDFLYYFSDAEKDYLKDYTFSLKIASAYSSNSNSITTKVFLPTYTQMQFGVNNNTTEGVKFDKFNSAANRVRTVHPMCAKYNKYCISKSVTADSASSYRLSSAKTDDTAYVYNVNSSGNIGYNFAARQLVGICPCICIPRAVDNGT